MKTLLLFIFIIIFFIGFINELFSNPVQPEVILLSIVGLLISFFTFIIEIGNR